MRYKVSLIEGLFPFKGFFSPLRLSLGNVTSRIRGSVERELSQGQKLPQVEKFLDRASLSARCNSYIAGATRTSVSLRRFCTLRRSRTRRVLFGLRARVSLNGCYKDIYCLCALALRFTLRPDHFFADRLWGRPAAGPNCSRQRRPPRCILHPMLILSTSQEESSCDSLLSISHF